MHYLKRDIHRFIDNGYLIDENDLLVNLKKLRNVINNNIDIVNISKYDNNKILKLANDISNGSLYFLHDENNNQYVQNLSLELIGVYYKDETIVKTVNYIVDVINKRIEKNLSDFLCVTLIRYKNALIDILNDFSRLYAFTNKYKVKKENITDVEEAKNILLEYEKDINILLNDMVVPLILNIKDKQNKKEENIKEINNFLDNIL